MKSSPSILFLSRNSLPPGRPITLNSQEIAIVLIETGDFFNKIDELYSFLSTREKERLKKMPLVDVCRRFIIQKAWLRLLLSELLHLPAPLIEFEQGSFGKPSLKNVLYSDHLHFNISHTKNFAIYAFSKTFILGVDVEERSNESINISDAVFSATTSSEKRALNELKPCERKTAFLKLWTKKEAVSKVLGYGLNMNFSNFHIGLREKESALFFGSQEINLVDISSPLRFFATLAFMPE